MDNRELADEIERNGINGRDDFSIEATQQIIAALRRSEPERKPTNAPFANCSFQECDLPGQCIGEGRCHHPAERQPSSDQVLVPREPTKAMCQAGQDACSYAEHDAGMVYRAMLAAAEAKETR